MAWPVSQEKRRAERAEQQRVRTEKDKERQARREVRASTPPFLLRMHQKNQSEFGDIKLND